jgi:predicted lactoylglutathione lyase
MTTPFARSMFVNLPVSDLKRSMEFFSKLGFEFNPKFTDEKAACMVLGPTSYVMLLTRPFFQGFTKREVWETGKPTEALLAISCPDRAAVQAMVKTAVENGGSPAMDAQDHGFMFGWSFYDPDGHHWEPMWMDPAAAQ